MSVRRFAAVATATLLTVPVLTSCSDNSSGAKSSQTPQEVLAQASEKLTETTGVHVTLATSSLPDGVSGIARAAGTVTQAPAFEGTINVVFAGQNAEVPVIAVDNIVYAQLPFAPGWNEVNPTEYGAPDPSRLTGTDGFPGLLDQTESVKAGKSVRGGANNAEVLTTYTGTVPGDAMDQIIPSSAGDSFDVEWQITEDGELRKATLEGVFYPQTDPMTYTVDFDDYDSEKDITAP